MRIWGRGRFAHLTRELRSPQARSFSNRLDRACGCRLAWHRKRYVYVVYRPTRLAGWKQPITYLDVGNDMCPLQFSYIPYISRAVRFADARRHGNWMRVLEDLNVLDRAASDERDRNFVDDRLPEYTRDLMRLRDMLRDGRFSKPVFIDLGKSTL